jgi:hypothetical protein
VIFITHNFITESKYLLTQKKDKIKGIMAAHTLPNKKHIPYPNDLIFVGKISKDKTVS